MNDRHGVTALKMALAIVETKKQEFPTGVPDEQTKLEVQSYLVSVKPMCETLKLSASGKQIWELEKTLQFQKPNHTEIGAFLVALIRTINGELDTVVFAYIAPQKVKYFEEAALFGEEVNHKFPSAEPEIKAAGNCLAADLNTAAVFHLMRATEVGLHALANNLGLTKIGSEPIEFCVWGSIINYIKANMSSLVKASTSQEKRENSQFYNGILLRCEAIKELWRNPVSHSGKIFLDNEALGICTHVEEFLRCLSTRVSEVV